MFEFSSFTGSQEFENLKLQFQDFLNQVIANSDCDIFCGKGIIISSTFDKDSKIMRIDYQDPQNEEVWEINLIENSKDAEDRIFNHLLSLFNRVVDFKGLVFQVEVAKDFYFVPRCEGIHYLEISNLYLALDQEAYALGKAEYEAQRRLIMYPKPLRLDQGGLKVNVF